MNVYNKVELEKLSIITEAKNAYRHNLISKVELDNIEVECKSKLYIPQLAIRIGLFLLVIILSAVVFGLLAFMFLDGFGSFGFISLFLFFITLGITYYLSTWKLHFGSGADNAFLYCSITFFMIWVASTFNSSSGFGSSFILFVICLAAALIFLDKLLVIISILAFFSSVYFALQKFIALDFLMLCIMTISFLVFFVANKYKGMVDYWNNGLLKVLLYSSLITAFLAINSLFVFESINDSFLFKTVFDILMVIIPMIYIFIGIKFKNIIFLRCGGVLFLVAIYCIIYMYAKNQIFEFVCLASAIILIISWWLTRYLSNGKGDFVFIDKSGFSNLEALGAINTATPPAEGFKFGGGSFGGGGASGDF